MNQPENPSDTITVGGLRITRATRAELAERMSADVRRARSGALARPLVVTSANGSVIASYHKDAVFRGIVDQSDIIDVDGMPLVFATRLLCRQPLNERVATTDFVLDACRTAVRDGLRFYFLGARPAVAARAAAHLRDRYPGLQIVGTHHGYFKSDEAAAICADVVAAKADILWVGLGSPRQERFAVENRDRLPGLAWIRTCGGLFDHYGGGVSRAPEWMQTFGLEWLYRAAREPTRLGGRYLVTGPAAVYHLATKTRD